MIGKNNPLNIRDTGNHWQGLRGNTKGFCNFVDLRAGFRAAVILINRYRSFGVVTVKGIINRWAPPSENSTDAYVDFVCEHSGMSASDNVDYKYQLISLLSAMCKYENGYYDYHWDKQLDFCVNLYSVLK